MLNLCRVEQMCSGWTPSAPTLEASNISLHQNPDAVLLADIMAKSVNCGNVPWMSPCRACFLQGTLEASRTSNTPDFDHIEPK